MRLKKSSFGLKRIWTDCWRRFFLQTAGGYIVGAHYRRLHISTLGTPILLGCSGGERLYQTEPGCCLPGLSFVTTRIILGLVFLVVTPIGVVKRLSGWDPLSRRGARSLLTGSYSERQRDHGTMKMF